jgi:hypothetical protein
MRPCVAADGQIERCPSLGVYIPNTREHDISGFQRSLLHCSTRYIYSMPFLSSTSFSPQARFERLMLTPEHLWRWMQHMPIPIHLRASRTICLQGNSTIVFLRRSSYVLVDAVVVFLLFRSNRKIYLECALHAFFMNVNRAV